MQLFFEREESELLDELRSVPAWTRDRKISDFAKRVRSLKTHIVLMSHLRGKLPPFNINARGAQVGYSGVEPLHSINCQCLTIRGAPPTTPSMPCPTQITVHYDTSDVAACMQRLRDCSRPLFTVW